MAGLWKSYENRLLTVLTCTFAVVFLDRAALHYLAPFVVKDLGLSNGQIGALASGLALSWAFSGVLVGRLNDRLGKPALVLTACIVVFSVCSGVSGLAGGFATLLAARLFMGLSEGPVLPIAQTLLASESSPHRRGLNMGVMQQFGSNILGAFIAPVLLVYLAQRFGWRETFLLAGVPGLLCAVWVWRTIAGRRRERAAERVDEPQVQPTPFPLREALRYRNIGLCAAIAALMIGQASCAFVFLPLYFVQVSGFSTTMMSFLMTFLGISAVFSSIAVPALSDRFGRRPVIAMVLAVTLIGPIGLIFAGISVPLIAGFLFIGFLSTGAAPLIMATVPTETLPSPHVAAVVGIVVGIAEIFAALGGPLLGGLLSDRYGLVSTIWLQIAFLVGAAGLVLFLTETAPRILARRLPGGSSA